jgi:serine/threonine-protein kinase
MEAPPRIGTVFAGYRIEAILGRGGMSVVYRAEHPRLASIVALKLLSPELAEDESFRERFVRESRTAASIAHPNIIPIYDAGDEDGVLYIAMRFVEGPDLKTLVRGGALPPERALHIGSQVAGALDAAHARDMIHRDVKPANVLLEEGAEAQDHAYLADFGLTKHVGSRSGITASGQFVGTIDYMAPEQIEGRPVDARADIYALGCVLFECLAGSPPFRRETEAATLWAHMRDEPPPVSAAAPGMPAAVDTVLAKALAKTPGERPESCAELVRELRGAFGEPVSAASAASATRVMPPPASSSEHRRSHRWWIAAAVGLVIGAGIASAAFLAFGEGTETTGETRTVTVTSAAPVGQVSFRTPSAAIGCASGSELRCDIRSGLRPRPAKPPSCKLDWGFGYSLQATGSAAPVCAGDTVIDPSARAVAYGTTWRRGGFSCLSKVTGLRCTNRDGHGFFLSRARSFRF